MSKKGHLPFHLNFPTFCGVFKVVSAHQSAVHGNQVELVAGAQLAFANYALKTIDVVDVAVGLSHHAFLTDEIAAA